MSNSSLVTKTIPAYAGNYTKGRARYAAISEITVHHCAGDMTIESLGAMWQRVGRNGSSHYGVQHGNVGQYVSEDDVAWTNSNWAANCRAVTIETANSGGAPGWPVATDTLQTLIKLVADIAKRNGLHPLVLGESLTWHSMYTATTCPGPYLKERLQYIVDEANKINGAAEGEPPAPDDAPALGGLYHVQVGAFRVKANADGYAKAMRAKGYQTLVKHGDDGLYRVQVGAFAQKANAEAYRQKLLTDSYQAIVIEG